MKSILLVLWSTLLIVQAARSRDDRDSSSQKTPLQWRTFDAGFSEAKKTGKKVLLDVYTDWCGWCKKLDKNVYGDPKVSGYINDHYIPVKLNPESATRVTYRDTAYSAGEFAQGFGITGYPTIIFFEPDGKPIDRLAGYVDANQFLPIIRFIGEDFYKKMSWDDFKKQPTGTPQEIKQN